MTDVIDLETWRRKPNVYPMFTVHVYKNSDNKFEVSMEVEDRFDDGMNDFMCTTHVQYFINGNQLDASVYMRSNDAIFGFINDLAWQQIVLKMLAKDLTHHSRPCLLYTSPSPRD